MVIDINPNHTTPVNASTKSKPGIRAQIRERFQGHMKDHPGTLTVVGGADFFGPRVTLSMLGDTFTGKIVDSAVSNKAQPTAIAIGSCDMIHDVCFSEDFSNALAIASVNDNAYDKFWICPHSIHGMTLRQIANAIADITYSQCNNSHQASNNSDTIIQPVAHKAVKFTVMTKWMLYLLSPFIPFLGEMIEMLPFFQNDYTIDDSDFCREFGVTATPYKDALKAYVDFYLEEKTAVIAQ